MRDALLVRFYSLVFAVFGLWILLGAPLLTSEWQDVPHRLQTMFTQLPARMVSIFALWR